MTIDSASFIRVMTINDVGSLAPLYLLEFEK